MGDHLRQAIGDGDGPILLELADVSFMDSSGVRALAMAHAAAPIRLRLGTLSPSVQRVLEITGVIRIFEHEVPTH